MLKQRFRLIMLLTAAAVGLVVVPASAETFLGDNNINGHKVPDVSPNTVTSELTSSLTQQKKAFDYWTPRRMKDASPMASPIPETKADGILKNVLPSQNGDSPTLPELPLGQNGAATEPSSPSATPKEPAEPQESSEVPSKQIPSKQIPGGTSKPASKAPGKRTKGGLTDALRPAATHADSASAKRWASGNGIVKTEGKVFLTMGGRDYYCSATVVKSANRDTVATAGHCLYEDGDFASNFVFMPGYDHGNTPFGKWSARLLKAPLAYTRNHDLNHDAGFAVLNKLNGRHIADVVGAQRIAFNAGRGAEVHALGYPVYDPYDGEELRYCAASARSDDQNADSTDQAIDCDMTEGSSGGGWLVNMGPNGQGTLVSVNSFSYSNNLDVMMGPALDGKIKAVYDAAQRA